jgi:general secretion pathway protein D
MRLRAAGIVILSCAGVVWAADTLPVLPSPTPPALCSNSSGAPHCQGDKKDLKAARSAFARGLKLEKSRDLDQAFYEFEDAARLVPQNVEYLTAREFTRQHLAGMHLEQGNTALLNGREVEALAEFRTALNLDPQNEFVQQRLNDALGPAVLHTAAMPQVVDSADVLVAKPIDLRHDIHYVGDSRGLLTAVITSYGLKPIFDDNFPSRRVRFDIQDADFSAAMRAVSAATKSFTVALEDTVVFVTVDNPENHRLYDRLGMRVFYIPGDNSPQDLSSIMAALRTLFDLKFVMLSTAKSTLTVRGPLPALEAANQFLERLSGGRPEVMFDLKVFQVSHTYMHNIGLHVPNNFNLFNIPVAALAAAGGQNVQDLINQLISSGGINQAGNQSLSALLAQLQGQQNSIFSQPLATFGGGLTLEGLSLDKLSAALSMNESSVRQLDHVQLRASQDKDATFKLGQRYPILNASFAPIYNNPAISKVVGNQSYTAPFPSVNYEDIGLTLKAKPRVHLNSDVAVELEVQFRTLGSVSSDGIPIIFNREYKGGILLKEGEPAVIAGMINKTDQRSLSGLPFFSNLPGFGALTSQNTKEDDEDELLILLTPHVVRSREQAESPEIWMR